MTDYDLMTKRALCRVVLLEYGFGPETLRERKVCPACGKANHAGRAHCADCGAALPEKTLYDLYRARHRCCPDCGIAIEVRRRLPDCRVYLVCADGHPEKLAALEKAVELKLIDGYCLGDLTDRQARAWLRETAKRMKPDLCAYAR